MGEQSCRLQVARCRFSVGGAGSKLQVAGSGVAAVGLGVLRFKKTGWLEHLSEKLLRFTQIWCAT